MPEGDRKGSYDYIVVGGGSAGCVIAGELAADPAIRVLLLECGDAAERNPEVLDADGYKTAFANNRVIWERFSEPQPGCRRKRLFMGSGRGLGGSGSVNAMVYTRGAAVDYAMWEAPGWTWSDIRGDFEALEARLQVNRRAPTEFTEVCIESAEAVGFRRKEDLNDGDLHGVLGYEWMNYHGDERRSSYVAFLRPQERAAANLDVRTGARVQRILFDGRRAVGVEYRDADGLHRAAATREVVLSAGALESPKLLMLSGVGPGAELRRCGVPVLHEVAGIGQNFHDHPNVTVFHRGRREVDFNYPQLYGFHRANPASDLPAEAADTCYVFYPARSSLREAMIRLLPSLVLPRRLYRVAALPRMIRSGVSFAFRSQALARFVARVYGIVVILGKPKSRGTVGLASANAGDQARIDPAYFADPEDMETMLRGVALARGIADAPPLAEWGNAELMPGRRVNSRAGLEKWIRGNAMTTYHYAGTCRLGEDVASVVDARLRVRGIDGLRVADASVVPTVPVSAMNAPSMLIGYRAARFLAEERRAS